MKLFVLPVAAALALAACDSTPADTTADATATADTGAAGTDTGVSAGGDTTIINPAPTATETVVVDPAAKVPTGVTIDGKDVDATIGKDGVNATVKVN